MKTVSLNIIGMTCASCANSIDVALVRLEGVKEVAVNVATDKAVITFDEEQVTLEKIVEEIGDHMFYIAALCNNLELNTDEILKKKYNEIETLGKFSLF